MKIISIGIIIFSLMLPGKFASARDSKDFWGRLADLAQAVGTKVIENEIDKAYREQEIRDLRYKARSFSNNSQVQVLLSNIEKLNNQNRHAERRITELEKMLIQQNKVIINNNTSNHVTGNEFIESFYSLSKAVSLTDTYSLLSNNAQQKLPFNDYVNWWNKTVHSVHVDNITQLGQDKYKVNLSYYKKDGSYQCSEDIIYLLWNNNEWLINDFSWGYCN